MIGEAFFRIKNYIKSYRLHKSRGKFIATGVLLFGDIAAFLKVIA